MPSAVVTRAGSGARSWGGWERSGFMDGSVEGRALFPGPGLASMSPKDRSEPLPDRNRRGPSGQKRFGRATWRNGRRPGRGAQGALFWAAVDCPLAGR